MADTKTDIPAKAEAAAPAASEASAPAAQKVAKPAEAAPKAPAAKAAKADTAKAAPAKRAARKPPRARKSAAPARVAARNPIKIEKGTKTMTNEAKKAAERFQNVFGDVNAQTKNVIERNTKLAEELTELTQGNVEAIAASTRVAAKGAETIGQEIASYNRKSFEDVSAALKGFAEVKSATDFFRLQADFVRNQFDSAVAESSKLSETVIKLAGDVTQPLANRYSVAAERMKAAVAL